MFAEKPVFRDIFCVLNCHVFLADDYRMCTKIYIICLIYIFYIVYHHLLTSNVKCEWLTHIKKILCTNGFPYVWENQGVLNEKQFLCLFEQRSKDIFIQECLSDISLSPRCRMYKEIKPTFGGELYLEMNINTRLRSCLTKLRLSSHKYLVERSVA